MMSEYDLSMSGSGSRTIKSFIKFLPKVDLHTHIEGTLEPAKARTLAQRNGVNLSPGLFNEDGSYQYDSFLDLVTNTYQAVARVMKTRADYAEVVFDYLQKCAQENTVYVELIACPGQCEPDRADISYRDMIDGISEGIDKAHLETGIEARINVTFERHRPPGKGAEKDADRILSYPHEYIVGLDIAGGETEGDLPQFQDIYRHVLKHFGRELGIRLHAGEGAGPENVEDALMLFHPVRIGHGVRSIESASVVQDLIDRGTVLEICPTSNICLMPRYQGDYKNHPARDLYSRGVKIVFGVDDPPMHPDDRFEACSIGSQYQIAHDKWGFSVEELLNITRLAVNASFAESRLKKRLRQRVEDTASFVGRT